MTLKDDDVRTTIIFMTFVVIFITLLFQGATLLPLIRWLGVGDPERAPRDESEARARAAARPVSSPFAIRHSPFAIRHSPFAIRQRWKNGDISDRGERLAVSIASGGIGIASAGSPSAPGDKALLLNALEAQRREVARLRDADRLGESVVERLETEIGIDDLVVCGEAHRLTGADQEWRRSCHSGDFAPRRRVRGHRCRSGAAVVNRLVLDTAVRCRPKSCLRATPG